MPRFKGQYSADWKAIATAAKDAADWRCVRCGHPHESPTARVLCDDRCDPTRHRGGLNDGKQRVLTIHHADGNKSNDAWWNLLPLCQVCHLQIQSKVIMDRPWILPHSEWFRPYVAGYYAARAGLPTDRDYVLAHVAELLELGQGVKHE